MTEAAGLVQLAPEQWLIRSTTSVFVMTPHNECGVRPSEAPRRLHQRRILGDRDEAHSGARQDGLDVHRRSSLMARREW